MLAVSSDAIAQQQPLPDDSDRYYVVIVTQDPPTVQCASLLRTIDSPALAKIRASTKVFRFTTRSVIYRERYAQQLPAAAAPLVALVRPDGGILYRASGSAIPDPVTLAQTLTAWAAANEQVASSHPDTQRPRIFPDRPRLIPDVNISPTVNVPPEAIAIGFAGLAVLALIVIFGLAAASLLIWQALR